MHVCIKKVTEDISQKHQFNTAISSVMELVNTMYTYKHHSNDSDLSKQVYETIVLLLSPFTPHLCEEIWNNLGHSDCVSIAKWPSYDEKYIGVGTKEGLLLIINPGDISNCLTFYLGIYFAISAFQKIYVAIFLFKKKNECALITLVSAIIMLFIGVLVFLNPFNKLMILEVCGLFSIFFGLIGFANALLLNKKQQIKFFTTLLTSIEELEDFPSRKF